MKGKTKALVIVLALIIFLAGVTASASVLVPSKAEINRDVTAALNQLYASNPVAKTISEKAVAVLVFPASPRGVLSSAGSMVWVPCARLARRSATSTRWPGHGAFRQVFKSTGMPCSS